MYNIDLRVFIVSRHTDTKWCSSQRVLLESIHVYFEEQPFAHSVKNRRGRKAAPRDNNHYFLIIDILKMNINTDNNESCQILVFITKKHLKTKCYKPTYSSKFKSKCMHLILLVQKRGDRTTASINLCPIHTPLPIFTYKPRVS